MGDYRHRIVDEILSDRIESAGAVVLEGPKWCGKTTTCERIAKSCIYLTDPDRRDQYLQIAQTEISTLLAGDSPRLIDEWQGIEQNALLNRGQGDFASEVSDGCNGSRRVCVP